MLNCSTCLFKGNIPGDCHVSCKRKNGVKLENVEQHGVDNGWFLHPFNFDPRWAGRCDGYVPHDFKVDSATDIQTMALYVNEVARYEAFNEPNIANLRDKDFLEVAVKKLEDAKLSDLLGSDKEFKIEKIKIVLKELLKT